MQTCKFSLTLHAANIMHLRGVTPAELVILRELHFKESNGSPIGADLQLEPGEALTVDDEGKAAQPGYFHQGSGKFVDPVDAVPPVTHKRTNREEVERLKRKYIAKIPGKKDSRGVFIDTFGESPMVQLPETFDQVLPQIGLFDEGTGKGLILPADVEVSDEDDGGQDLDKKTRAEVVSIAVALKLAVRPTDSKGVIISKILKAQAKAAEPAAA